MEPQSITTVTAIGAPTNTNSIKQTFLIENANIIGECIA